MSTLKNLEAERAALYDAIVQACDCLGEGLAASADPCGTDASTLEAVEDALQKALLALWRVRWEKDAPGGGEIRAVLPEAEKAESEAAE